MNQRQITTLSFPIFFTVFTAFLLLVTTSCIPTTADSHVIEDSWFRILLNGKDAGHNRTTVTRKATGEYETVLSQNLALRRAETTMEVASSSSILETESGEIREVVTRVKMSGKEKVTHGRVAGDKLVVQSSGAGSQTTTTLGYDPEARGPYWIDRNSRKQLRTSGSTFSVVTIFPELSRCGEISMELGKTETMDIEGRPMLLRKRKTTWSLLPGKPQLEWVDDEGQVWRSLIEILGMELEIIRSSEKSSRKRASELPEIMLSSAVRPDRPVPNTPTVQYRLSLLQSDFETMQLGEVFQAAGQEIVDSPSKSVRVVRVSTARPGKAVTRPVPVTPELSSFLESNALVQSSDEKIQAKAREICDGESDAFAAAKKIELFVQKHIQNKNLETGFASAREALDTASGDCTEHGVLLAALARAAGIPARLVTGLVYDRGEFLGHLWTEVYIDRWIALDATRAHKNVGPRHIAVATSSLSESGFGDVVVQLAQIMGNLKIEVLSAE